MTDWQDFLWWAAVATAVTGGVVSTSAYVINWRGQDGKEGDMELKQKIHVLRTTVIFSRAVRRY